MTNAPSNILPFPKRATRSRRARCAAPAEVVPFPSRPTPQPRASLAPRHPTSSQIRDALAESLAALQQMPDDVIPKMPEMLRSMARSLNGG